MRSRTTRLAAVLLAGVLVAAACGGDDDEAATGGDTETSETTEAAAPKPGQLDEDSRFTTTEAFCDPAEPEDPGEVLEASADGITADSVTISHVRVKLEDLEGIGFAIPLGDPADQAETFVKILNEQCGGVYGRKINLHTVEMEVPGLSSDADADAQRVCIEVAEDQQSVISYSLSGAGSQIARCVAGQHDVIFITTYAITDTEIEQSEGRLFSMTFAPSDIMKFAVEELADELEGKRIGVVHQDSLGDPQIVQQGLLAALEEHGLDVARVDVIGCNNSSRCTDNVIPSVQGMVADNIDVIFPLLNVVSLPGYMKEMATQGVQPGDVEFYNVGYLAQDGELVTGKIVEFGGPEAGELYDGTTVISATMAGQHRAPAYQPDEFATMCNRLYAEHSDVTDQPYDVLNDEENSKFGATAGQCALIRIVARALEAAGPNPSREEIAEAMGNLGTIQLSGGGPGSFRPDKPTAPDAITRVVFRYPCPTETTNKSGACMVPESDYMPLPQG